jgi:hypothetical protein
MTSVSLLTRAFLTSIIGSACLGQACATEISLNQFSGNETVINMSEIPGGGQQGALGAPADTWNRTVKGVKFVGGKEMWIGGRTAGTLNSNPFQNPPTEGDPQGFSGASLGSWLTFFTPSPAPYVFSLDFSGLPEMPRRVGFLWEAGRTNPLSAESTFTATVQYSDGPPASYSFPVQASRLIAVESDVAIRSIGFSWSPPVNFGDGPRVSIDDIRFEAVPEPASPCLVSIGLAALASLAWRSSRRRQ